MTGNSVFNLTGVSSCFPSWQRVKLSDARKVNFNAIRSRFWVSIRQSLLSLYSFDKNTKMQFTWSSKINKSLRVCSKLSFDGQKLPIKLNACNRHPVKTIHTQMNAKEVDKKNGWKLSARPPASLDFLPLLGTSNLCNYSK